MNGNAAMWFVDRHPKEGRGARIAFREARDGGRELTYDGLVELSERCAGALLRTGVRRGERAAMFVLDEIEFPVIFWGAVKVGIVPVALNTLLSTDIYTRILLDSRAAVAFVSASLLQVVLPAIEASPHIRSIVVIGGHAPKGSTRWENFFSGAEPSGTIECADDEVAFWLYSSGSTGLPKGVRHVHGSMQYTCNTYGAHVLQISEADTVFSAAKLFFAYGLGNGMSFPLSVGATALLFNGRPTPEAVSEILDTHKPTIYCGVPTLYAALLQHWQGGGAMPRAPLRACISAGEALPAEIGRKWQALWGVDIMDGVGSTEMLHIFLSNGPDDVEYGTSGNAVPGYEIRLVGEDGAEVPNGTIGELMVRGDSAASDYWNQRHKSRETFVGSWTRTGDRYFRAENGRLVYCGRTDDMFKVSGIWVSPFEVEQALVEHPSVLEAAVVARRDANNLEKPKAFVVLNDGEHIDALEGIKDFIKEKIGKWKYPRWVEVVDDLPKTATGKIQRFRLREDAR